jgi:hypothetical protein
MSPDPKGDKGYYVEIFDSGERGAVVLDGKPLMQFTMKLPAEGSCRFVLLKNRGALRMIVNDRMVFQAPRVYDERKPRRGTLVGIQAVGGSVSVHNIAITYTVYQ